MQVVGKDLERDSLFLEGRAVQGKLHRAREADLHGERASWEVSLGRHMVTVLTGAKMHILLKKQ